MENKFLKRMEDFREFMVKLTADEKLFRELTESFARTRLTKPKRFIKPEIEVFRNILDKMNLLKDCERVCMTICGWEVDEWGHKKKVCEEHCKWICEEIDPRARA